MSTSSAALNALAAAVVERAWGAAWQWTLIVLVVAAPLQWLLRRQAPAVRYWIWQIVLLKLLVMPVWVLAIRVAWLPAEQAPLLDRPPQIQTEPLVPILPEPNTTPADAVVERTSASVAVADPVPTFPSLTWQAWILIGWLVMLLLQLLRLAAQGRRLSRLLDSASPADASLLESVGDAARALRLRTLPRMLVTSHDVSPFVCGILRPVLVLPQALTARLSPAQFRQVLLHELSHIRRRDLLWGWIPEIVRMLWFFHPLVHWACYRLRLERELACDQVAITLSGQTAGEYAATLVDVVARTLRSVVANPPPP